MPSLLLAASVYPSSDDGLARGRPVRVQSETPGEDLCQMSVAPMA